MNNWKGIILAGGLGTRLYPLTKSVSKQLLPVYDKPMIYYSLSVLMLAEIKDILIIITPEHKSAYKKLLGNGNNLGIKITYITQSYPRGLPDAFILGQKFIKKSNVCLILGDNIFYGQMFKSFLLEAKKRKSGATVFSYQVNNPEDFGVIKFNKLNQAISIEEKPKKPKSNYAVAGLYFYDNKVIDYAKNLKTSKRGELEISDLNNEYIKNKCLYVKQLGRGFAWLDTGTHENINEASTFVQVIEKRQGLKISCPEEIAFRNGWLDKVKIKKIIKEMIQGPYSEYLQSVIKN